MTKTERSVLLRRYKNLVIDAKYFLDNPDEDTFMLMDSMTICEAMSGAMAITKYDGRDSCVMCPALSDDGVCRFIVRRYRNTIEPSIGDIYLKIRKVLIIYEEGLGITPEEILTY